jgi:hypothetical protein
MRPAFVAAVACAALLAGCAIAPPRIPPTGPDAECREVFRRVAEAVAEAGVEDGLAARVEGFPYLRVNRFLASYAGERMDDAQFAEWMNRMVALGRQARALEIANLPPERAEALGHALWAIARHRAWVGPALADCTERLAAADYSDPARRTALRDAAHVPDDYATANRILGLYWLTRLPFASGIRGWNREVHETFARPLEALPVTGRLVAFAPPWSAPSQVAMLLARASANPLGIPDPRGDDLDALFRAFAPAYLVDTATPADVPGELGWGEDGLPQVVSRRPVVYRRVSHARYEGRALLQLNYSIWFPERPRGAGWDILGGRLDGVMWRVTLAPDGEPLLFDSIHACGCYHLFFPTERARLKPQADTLDETALVPQTLPRIGPRPPVTLRLAAGTHYIERVVIGAASGGAPFEYAFREDDALRSVELPGGGRRSAFRPDGIVPGTERGERWLFWPMGVPEPGAMRQWGRHATAFVGRRHFDDPGLLERYFALELP